ncbi:hypothetical protein [Methylosinus sp. C49]|uniref:hypothetical protein n=1 Tax=Methylosinus sp. C49 TaxID=2699395 RepID=UPI001379E9AD|nr:hypothetical protein [Methylosinus sp. C49]
MIDMTTLTAGRNWTREPEGRARVARPPSFADAAALQFSYKKSRAFARPAQKIISASVARRLMCRVLFYFIIIYQ